MGAPVREVPNVQVKLLGVDRVNFDDRLGLTEVLEVVLLVDVLGVDVVYGTHLRIVILLVKRKVVELVE